VSEIVSITCVSTDNEGVEKVELWVDGVSTNVTDDNEPYSLDWNTVSYGQGSLHTITVRAYDSSENKRDSEPITLVIDNSQAYPTPVVIYPISYQDSSFNIFWSKSLDSDFAVYRLFESMSDEMSDEMIIYETIEIEDTSYVINDITEDETRYYQVIVEDEVGFQSESNIVIGYAYPSEHGDNYQIEIVTWNIQNFPKSDQTVGKVISFMEDLDADIYCIQEIEEKSKINDIAEALNGYDSFISETTYYLHLGVIYKSTILELEEVDDYFIDHSGFASRPPLKVDFIYEIDNSQYNFTVIIMHLKCCGDGNIDAGNEDDEEYRRYGASIALKNYIDNSMDNDNVIVVGDWNDLIVEENDSNNIFMNFIEDEDNYYFADMSIAQGPSSYWSYPAWPSHIDHILITNELFDEFDTSEISTIRADDYIDDYFNDVSDHRPVMWKFIPNF
tara:strand:- start:6581 stop:7918 length:1338 start_codon:yes stop_codon:yes gene_type:complete